MHKKREIGVILALAAMLTMPAAHAHNLASDSAGFLAGMSHPVLGLDHVLAMLAVGLWGAQQDRNRLWRLPLAFASMMIVGAALALAGIGLPAVEAGITTSVLVLGLLLAAAVRVAPSMSMALVGVFAVFHGYAHGMQMPQMAPAVPYGLGLLITATAVQFAGIALGGELRGSGRRKLRRWGGAAIACAGVLLGA